jgi:hypothetical protein
MKQGSSNSVLMRGADNKSRFYISHLAKDFFVLQVVLMAFFAVVFVYDSNMFNRSENFIRVDTSVLLRCVLF